MRGRPRNSSKVELPRRSGLLVRQRYRGGDARYVAVGAGGVAGTGGVLYQAGVARSKDVLRPVLQADLQLARKYDDELTPWGAMIVRIITHRCFTESDVGGCLRLGPVGRLGQVNVLDLGKALGVGEKSIGTHCNFVSTYDQD